jgi:hypothetical protein
LPTVPTVLDSHAGDPEIVADAAIAAFFFACSKPRQSHVSDNAAERSLRGLALGRKAWLFAGFDRGAERAAVMNTLIMTARLNDIDPKAWLADLFARIADHP